MGISSLDAALSGLRVAQQQITVISNNVANASTPGFTRKILPQSSQAIDGVTVGVLGETIIRQVDISLERDLWTQVSSVGFLEIQQTFLARIEQFHGPPDAELSIAAELAQLQDAFAALSDAPENQFLLAGVVDQATDTANKINDLSDLITRLRNDAQSEIDTAVTRINDLLEQIAELNGEIAGNLNVGQTTAVLEDKRSEAVTELSELIEISFFTRGDGMLIVQTNQGVELAGETAEQLNFTATPVPATGYYPGTLNGIFIGDPADSTSIDITAQAPGGKLGGLLDLRDVTFPKQLAQLDELAHKLALRFEAQGLRLFTDASGNLPSDNPPDPTTVPNPTPVDYVGFSASIQVSQAIIADNSLVQQGTAVTDLPVQPGSNEVIRRIVEFAFGDTDYQQAVGTIDMRSFGTGGVDLQNWLGVFSENTIQGGRGVSSFPTVADLVNSANGALDPPTEEFQITFEEPRTGTGPFTITINLTAADLQPGATALDRIVAEINAQIGLAAIPASLAASATVGANGEIVLNSRGTMTIDGSFGPTGMTQTGLTFLGLNEGTFPPTDPYFDLQIGNDPPVRVFIEPGDTEAELIDKLVLNSLGDAFNPVGDTTGIPGLTYDEATFLATGELIIRPGEDFNNPEFGGDLSIIGGPFVVDPAVAGSPDITALGAGNGVNMVSALFGSFNVGPPSQDVSPIVDVGYGSQTNGSLAPPIPTLSFRETLLGPNAGVSTNLNGITNILDYSRRMVNEHAQELVLIENRIDDQETLKSLLETQLANESGVNIDEELGQLILVQTAFSAAARVVTAVQESFDELLRAV